MAWFRPVTRMNNLTKDKMVMRTMNQFGCVDKREIPAKGFVYFPYREGIDRVDGEQVMFNFKADNASGRVVEEDLFPITVFACSDINIDYKLLDGSEDEVFLDFHFKKDKDFRRIGLVRWFRDVYASCAAYIEAPPLMEAPTPQPQIQLAVISNQPPAAAAEANQAPTPQLVVDSKAPSVDNVVGHDSPTPAAEANQAPIPQLEIK